MVAPYLARRRRDFRVRERRRQNRCIHVWNYVEVGAHLKVGCSRRYPDGRRCTANYHQWMLSHNTHSQEPFMNEGLDPYGNRESKLMWASWNGDVSSALKLLAAGADPSWMNDMGFDAIKYIRTKPSTPLEPIYTEGSDHLIFSRPAEIFFDGNLTVIEDDEVTTVHRSLVNATLLSHPERYTAIERKLHDLFMLYMLFASRRDLHHAVIYGGVGGYPLKKRLWQDGCHNSPLYHLVHRIDPRDPALIPE